MHQPCVALPCRTILQYCVSHCQPCRWNCVWREQMNSLVVTFGKDIFSSPLHGGKDVCQRVFCESFIFARYTFWVTAFCRIEKCRINIWHFEFRVFSLLHFFTSFNFPLMLVCFQAKVHSCRFEILHRYCHSVWEYCKMNHLIFGLMQISSPGYYLTWIFPSGKNFHAVEFPGFKCDSKISSHSDQWFRRYTQFRIQMTHTVTLSLYFWSLNQLSEMVDMSLDSVLCED